MSSRVRPTKEDARRVGAKEPARLSRSTLSKNSRVAAASLGFLALLVLVALACQPKDDHHLTPDPPGSQERTSPSQDLAEPITSYQISARLDERRHQINGKGTIRFVNQSKRSVKEVYVHLYLNAFENDDTLFLRNRGGRSGKAHGRRGSIEVKSLRSPSFDGIELWDTATKHSPEDPHDRTDIRVKLPHRVPPGSELILHMEFKSELPEIVERTGYHEDFHFVGQWYPKLAKHNSDGSWEHFAFHPFAEFYADFGDYDVTLDVPETYIVGSTGQTVSTSTQKGRTVHRILAPSVHDFAWTAWPHFNVKERQIEGVTVRLLSPKGSPTLDEVTFKTTERGLQHLNRAYGRYPYPHLTIVQPPLGAMRAGGMEYPGLITTRGTEVSARSWVRDQELVTIHELAHLWFQGTIATNEPKEPFLDEGLASYAEWRFLEEQFAPGSFINAPGLNISRIAVGRLDHFLSPRDQAIALPASDFRSFAALGSLVYARSALALDTLGRVFSEQKLHAALHAYARDWQFSHPTSEDFFASLEEGLGAEVRSVAEDMFLRNGTIDLSVPPPTTRPTQTGSTSEIIVLKHGSLTLPYSVLVELEDGTSERQAFLGKQEKESFLLDHSSPIRRIRVDPERRILLDENLLNNEFLASAGARKQQFHSGVGLSSWLLLLGAL